MSMWSEKVTEALRASAAEFLAREAGPQSLITVTRAEVSEDGKQGRIYLSVLPEKAEAAAIDFANRQRKELSMFFRKRIRGAFPPHFEFMIDPGEKLRHRLDELS